MLFSSRLGRGLLLGLLLLGSVYPAAQAQSATDTLDTRPGAEHGLGTMLTKDGRRIRAYLPNEVYSFTATFGYFLTSPKQHPIPPVQTMRVENLRCLSIRGRYYETIYLEGQKTPWVMGFRVCEGPVELFALAVDQGDTWLRRQTTAEELKQRRGLPKSEWLVRRRNGQLEPVSHSRFRQQIGDLLQDCEPLSQRVRNGDRHYRHQDLPYIVDEYNRWQLGRAEQSAPPASR